MEELYASVFLYEKKKKKNGLRPCIVVEPNRGQDNKFFKNLDKLTFTVISRPKTVTDAARLGYSVTDSDVLACNCCRSDFEENDTKHLAVPVVAWAFVIVAQKVGYLIAPSTGWDHSVRVCDQCAAKKGQL